jgi:hypothetical protein
MIALQQREGTTKNKVTFYLTNSNGYNIAMSVLQTDPVIGEVLMPLATLDQAHCSIKVPDYVANDIERRLKEYHIPFSYHEPHRVFV